MKTRYSYPIVPAEIPTCTFRREDGAEVYITARKYRGEPGSLAIPDTVEILYIRDALGNHVELTDDEMAWAQREAEKALA